MAVAVKNSTEAGTSSPFDRLPVVSLLGVIYFLASLAIIFKLVPMLWAQYVTQSTAITANLMLGLAMIGSAVVLALLGVRLLGPRPLPGVKAGIFVGLLLFLVVLLLTRWIAGWIESLAYDKGWFNKQSGEIASIIAGLAILFFAVRFWFRPGTERMLVGFEEQGWFSMTSYKRQQGMRVRRGTILGILVLIGAGVWTLVSHGSLQHGSPNWEIQIPFTDRVAVTRQTAGDAAPLIKEKFGVDWKENPNAVVQIDRFALRDEINSRLDPNLYVKIYNPENYNTELENGHVYPKQEYDAEVKRLKEAGQEDIPDAVPPIPAKGNVEYDTLRILPAVQFTVPLLLILLALWLAWRIVNMPTFADFLIATEAELNKVSWTPRKRLLQDTVVVLTTVFLMAFYLFIVDQVVTHTLSWKPIGIILISDEDTGTTKGGTGPKPW
jgi:preprotein translocase SecE subunit